MPEQIEQATEIQVMADEIRDRLKAAFDFLIQERDRQYSTAIAPLNAEAEKLEQESISITQAAESLRLVLPAQERELRRESDRLLVEGKIDEGAAKLAEAEKVGTGLATMEGRQREISRRLEGIEQEKQGHARRIFQSWHRDCQRIIRPIEHGLFVVILDGLQQSFFDFQNVTNTIGDGVLNTLFNLGHVTDLTADEKSAEWQAGFRWYSGRGRR